MGALWTATIWLWLEPSASHRGFQDPVYPLIFSHALPSLLAWLPLTLVAPFLVRGGKAARVIALLPAAAALMLFAGRRLTLEIGGIDSDLLLVISLSAVIQLTTIVYAVTHPGRRLSPRCRVGAGTLTLLAYLVGALLSGFAGSFAGVPIGLLIGALLVALGGAMPSAALADPTSPWIAAERRVARIARLLALLRMEKPARDRLLAFALLFGLTLSSLARVPSFWSEFQTDTTIDETRLPTFALLIAGLLLGFGLSSLPFPRRRAPAGLAALLILGAVAALFLLVVEPAIIPVMGLLISLPLGLTARISRETLLDALDRKGHRLPLETEALIGTTLAAATLVFGGLAALDLHWLRLPVTVLFLLGFVASALLWWRGLGESPRSRETTPPALDAYLPGYAPAADREESGPDGRAITILYEVPEENFPAFHEAMTVIAKVRRRQGALHWRLSRDLENPKRFTESYLLESWSDYQEVLRHEAPEDRIAKQRIFDLNDWDSLPHESHEAISEV